MATAFKEMVAAARAKIGAVSAAEAAKLAAGGATILDVREPGELAGGRIDGAFVHVPRGLLEPKADPDTGMGEPGLLAAKGAGPVLVLCATGGRAALAAATLTEMGYDGRVIEGGFGAWKEAGLPTTSG